MHAHTHVYNVYTHKAQCKHTQNTNTQTHVHIHTPHINVNVRTCRCALINTHTHKNIYSGKQNARIHTLLTGKIYLPPHLILRPVSLTPLYLSPSFYHFLSLFWSLSLPLLLLTHTHTCTSQMPSLFLNPLPLLLFVSRKPEYYDPPPLLSLPSFRLFLRTLVRFINMPRYATTHKLSSLNFSAY